MEKVYNLSQLEMLSGGSDDFVKSMIEVFLEHTPSQVEALVNFYEAKSYEEMGKVAHKIKPNIDLFGIQSISTEIRDIEKAGKSGILPDGLEAKVSKVNHILTESFSQLKKA